VPQPVRPWSCQVPPRAAGRRLDVFLGEHAPELSRAQAQRLIREGRCTVNGVAAKSGQKLASGDDIALVISEPAPRVEAHAGALDVLYEDDWLIVLNKSQGVAVHPAPGTGPDTLLNALAAHLDPSCRPSFVHRLDKDTSGAILAAKTVAVHRALKEQMDAGAVKRTYWAVVCGAPRSAEGTIDAPLAPARGVRGRMAVDPEGRRAVTHYRTLTAWEAPVGLLTLLEVRLETGRTHQIRVHFAYLGHPLLGDPVYGAGADDSCPELCGQALHSRCLQFVHPRTLAQMSVEAPLPLAWERVIGRCVSN
jgi:23S rRNA pseudouridine1911/1915/1917 synthase